MNDNDRQALNRRVLERLHPGETLHEVGDGSRPGDGFELRDSSQIIDGTCLDCVLLSLPLPDYTRDANAALRDLAPLVMMGCIDPYHIDDVLHDVIAEWYGCGSGMKTSLSEAVALALCLAVDSLPKP